MSEKVFTSISLSFSGASAPGPNEEEALKLAKEIEGFFNEKGISFTWQIQKRNMPGLSQASVREVSNGVFPR